ncbi:MAG TPA: phosphotransferase [Geminicoccaceae bacterium]|nr:phosphotransferase [Geminicoccaceae bacterium]
MTQLLERPLVLPPDVVITPITEFEAEARERLGAEADEFALTRVRSRDTSKIIGPGAAELLRRFREPTTFVQAVAALSRARSEDAERLLDVAAPLVIQLIASGMLVPADAAAPERTTASLTAGADAVGFEVVRCVQILEDSEVYLARHPAHGFAAVKLAREGYRAIVEPQLAREAAVLRRLDGKAGPPLLGAGDMGDRPYLAVGWCHGIDAAAAAVEARELGDPAALLALLGGIAAAYAALHAQGVLHGDVHPRNLLVDGWGKVTPIDFGLARLADEPDAANLRGGATFYTDPGFAAAVMAGRAPQVSTPRRSSSRCARSSTIWRPGDITWTSTCKASGCSSRSSNRGRARSPRSIARPGPIWRPRWPGAWRRRRRIASATPPSSRRPWRPSCRRPPRRNSTRRRCGPNAGASSTTSSGSWISTAGSSATGSRPRRRLP